MPTNGGKSHPFHGKRELRTASVAEPFLWPYSGVRVIAGAVGTIPSILDSPLLGRSLGGLVQDASDSEEEDDSTSTAETKVCGARKSE